MLEKVAPELGSPALSPRCRSLVASSSRPSRTSRRASGMPVERLSSMKVPLPGMRNPGSIVGPSRVWRSVSADRWSDRPGSERGLDRPRCPEGPEYLDRRDRRQRQLRADVVGDRGEPEYSQLDLLACLLQLLEFSAAEVLCAQHERPALDGVVHHGLAAVELTPDGRADEVGAVGEEPLVDEQVDLSEVDQPDVDGDLFALVDLGHSPSSIRKPG